MYVCTGKQTKRMNSNQSKGQEGRRVAISITIINRNDTKRQPRPFPADRVGLQCGVEDMMNHESLS